MRVDRLSCIGNALEIKWYDIKLYSWKLSRKSVVNYMNQT